MSKKAVLVEERSSIVYGFRPVYEGEVLAETLERWKVRRLHKPWWAQEQVTWVLKEGTYERCREITLKGEDV